MKRLPAVAGQFYPDTEKLLKIEIEKYIDPKKDKSNVIGVMSPHAGYMCSGMVAGQLFSEIHVPDTVIILGPNHRGLGSDYAIMSEGQWQTPLGTVDIDQTLAYKIREKCSYIKEDEDAHRHEHSLEVQVPFLQYVKKDVRIVPICIGGYDEEVFECVGKCIAESIKETESKVLIIASSDMTHYESAEAAKEKDEMALQAILKLDEKKMLHTVSDYNITMCGYAPTAIMLIAAKELGAKKAHLVSYMNSGDAIGDYSSVVGYAGVTVS
ncbi:MAG: AmmeMemoRadiSam system protein B [Candidatus Ancaeobacter aquaticus]|nr:AmmeMemoRadiSam system protein B [Candidatus Ancaeobacter aquaticus]